MREEVLEHATVGYYRPVYDSKINTRLYNNIRQLLVFLFTKNFIEQP